MITQANTLTSELVAELIALELEAREFFTEQKSYTKVIFDVFHGVTLLTQESLDKVNNALMVAHQRTFNVETRISALREKLPEGYQDDDRHSWNTWTGDLLRDTHHDLNQAVIFAKKISVWASLKIDGTSYPQQ